MRLIAIESRNSYFVLTSANPNHIVVEQARVLIAFDVEIMMKAFQLHFVRQLGYLMSLNLVSCMTHHLMIVPRLLAMMEFLFLALLLSSRRFFPVVEFRVTFQSHLMLNEVLLRLQLLADVLMQPVE